MAKHVVVSLSGGMDSSTLLLRYLKEYDSVTAISFDYGQKHRVELERAQSLVDYLCYKYVNTSTPNVLSVLQTAINDIYYDVTQPAYNNYRFATTVVNNKLYIAYKRNTFQLGFFYLDSTLFQSNTYYVTTNQIVTGCISIFGDASNNIWCGYTTSTSLYGLIVDSTLSSTVLANTLVYNNINPAGNVVYNVTGLVNNTTATFYYETQNALLNPMINQVTLTLGGVAGSNTLFLTNQGIASKIFVYNSTAYLLTLLNSGYQAGDFQPTYFIVDQSGNTVGKLAPGVAGPYYARGLLPNINIISSSNIYLPYLQQDYFTTISGNIFYKAGVQLACLNFAPTAPVVVLPEGVDVSIKV